MKRFVITLAIVFAGSLVVPAFASADSATAEYEFDLEHQNISQASNGDTVAVTGSGAFSVHAKSASGGGSFTHTFSGGGSVTGSWTVSKLIEYQSYGCGVVLGNPIPANLCGGALKLAVHLEATVGGQTMERDGILTIFCIIGPNPPSTHDDPSGEGIHLVVPGIANFNKIVSGMNVFIRE